MFKEKGSCFKINMYFQCFLINQKLIFLISLLLNQVLCFKEDDPFHQLMNYPTFKSQTNTASASSFSNTSCALITSLR